MGSITVFIKLNQIQNKNSPFPLFYVMLKKKMSFVEIKYSNYPELILYPICITIFENADMSSITIQDVKKISRLVN